MEIMEGNANPPCAVSMLIEWQNVMMPRFKHKPRASIH